MESNGINRMSVHCRKSAFRSFSIRIFQCMKMCHTSVTCDATSTAQHINISRKKSSLTSRDTLVSHIGIKYRDFFDPTHFDRTTDFPHFGLCVRSARVRRTRLMPIRSHLLSRSTSYVFIILVVLRAAHRPRTQHTHTHTQALAAHTVTGFSVWSTVDFFILPSHYLSAPLVFLLHAHTFSRFRSLSCSRSRLLFLSIVLRFIVRPHATNLVGACVNSLPNVCKRQSVCWLSVYVYLVGLRRNLSAAYIINLNASSTLLPRLYIQAELQTVHRVERRTHTHVGMWFGFWAKISDKNIP